MVSLKIQVGENLRLEVEASNEDELANIVNRTLKRLCTRTVWNEVKESF